MGTPWLTIIAGRNPGSSKIQEKRTMLRVRGI
jgi:hypothetical protein